ncbi:unnamed protein product [Haemonchus placei]|uniref:TFIIS central domain-containing protein n=1 Tax=Haemonchus placei TaxID=6290 RepID=A0A0N4X4M4_HAEPC|nr:unnamed protein product [Haemonchus placei]
MSFHAKEEAAAFIIERLRETEAYKFIQSLVRESVERIINPGAHTRVKKLSDQENVDSYEDEAVGKCLEKFKLKHGAVLKRPTVPTKEITTQPIFTAKPEPEYEDVKKSLRDRIQVMADESVKKKEELMQREETVSDEEIDEEQEGESSGSEEKSSHSSTIEELSDIESISGIDQLLESDRSGSISF